MDDLELENVVRTLDEGEAAYALREAWNRVYNAYPSDNQLAVLWAKSCLETGHWKAIHCYNFGNIKATVAFENLEIYKEKDKK